MSAVRQLPLDLPQQETLGRDAFCVSPSNAEALLMIDAWRDWPGGKLLLIGPEGAGKTHLAHIWAEAAGAAIVDAADLRADAVPAFTDLAAVAVEGGDTLRGLPMDARQEAERALFHLHNELAAHGGHLLVTGRVPPMQWDLLTPDLLSRLSAASAVTLPAPDDTLLLEVMAKLFRDRQKLISPDLLPHVVTRMERSLRAAQRVVATLDAAALEKKAVLNARFAAGVEGWKVPEDPS
ncbi:MAG: DnaA/Hda family protein [Pseudomonadota bacterium]